MKNLVLIRHAKSSWDQPALADIDRPLNPRGERDAPFMGGLLKARGLIPDRIVSSRAERASQTARLIAGAMGCGLGLVELRDGIYGRSSAGLIELVREFDDAWNRVCLIGHNPELTELVERLTGENLAHLPTCGIASIEFAVDSWAPIMAGAGRLVWFDYPKRTLRLETAPTGSSSDRF